MPTTYNLNFTIDAAGVAAITGANQYITIVKQVNSSCSASTVVAWLAFPAALMIPVSWQETYFLYATNQQAQVGVQLLAISMTTAPAIATLEYPFNSYQLFGAPSSGEPAGTFAVNNQVGNDNWQFGLAQYALVGTAPTPAAIPLNILPVLNSGTATFVPEETVSIFLQSFSGNGVVITNVPDNALSVALSAGTPSANIGFDDSQSTFFLESLNPAQMARAHGASRAGRRVVESGHGPKPDNEAC